MLWAWLFLLRSRGSAGFGVSLHRHLKAHKSCCGQLEPIGSAYVTRIVEVLDFVCQGVTEPVICRAEDGHEYIVKGKYAGNRALIAEWVAGRLGKMLELPIPYFEQLLLDPLIFDYGVQSKQAAHLGKGTVFGSRREPNVVEIRPADVPMIELKLRAQVLAFDWWLMNPDRTLTEDAGNPNLLWDEARQQLVVMDHNLAFSPSLMGSFWEDHAFREAERLWTATFCEDMSAKFSKALSELPEIWAELPEDWTEIPTDLTFAAIEQVLSKPIHEAKQFWSPR